MSYFLPGTPAATWNSRTQRRTVHEAVHLRLMGLRAVLYQFRTISGCHARRVTAEVKKAIGECEFTACRPFQHQYFRLLRIMRASQDDD